MQLKIDDQYGNLTPVNVYTVGFDYQTRLYWIDVSFDRSFRYFYLPWVNGIRPLRRIIADDMPREPMRGEYYAIYNSEWVDDGFSQEIIIRIHLRRVKSV